MNKTNIRNSQIGGIGDNWHIEGGVNFNQQGQHVATQFNIAGNVYEFARPQPVDEETLATACERLDALPLDRVSDPAPLPYSSRMSLRANPLFVGREGDFKRLVEALKGGQTAAIGQVAAASSGSASPIPKRSALMSRGAVAPARSICVPTSADFLWMTR